MTEFLITKKMMEKLEYDTNFKTTVPDYNGGVDDNSEPTIMFIFHQSDLDAATYNLAKSMENPFSAKAIVTVLVQESCITDFKDKLIQKLLHYSPRISSDARLIKSLDIAEKLSAETICLPEVEKTRVSPTLVCNFTQEYFGQQSGIVTLHIFRTTKEAITLSQKEKLFLTNASIWCENHARAFEVITALPQCNFFVNCNDISLKPIQSYIQYKKPIATIENSYHYESMIFPNGQQKNVVFPFGTIFAN